MQLTTLLFRHRNQQLASELARQIARDSQPVVWDRVRGRIFEMNVAEARGYVRARAWEVLRTRTETAMAMNQRQDAALAQRILFEASERLVQRIIADLLAGSSIARRAAA